MSKAVMVDEKTTHADVTYRQTFLHIQTLLQRYTLHDTIQHSTNLHKNIKHLKVNAHMAEKQKRDIVTHEADE